MSPPNEKPDHIRPVTSISPNHEYLPALTGAEVPVDPARAYLLSLNSPRSRQTMGSFLGVVARLLGAESASTCIWGSLRRHHIMAVTELLRFSARCAARDCVVCELCRIQIEPARIEIRRELARFHQACGFMQHGSVMCTMLTCKEWIQSEHA